jgi:alanine dehydrogenase
VQLLAEQGAAGAVKQDAALARGANVWRGALVCEGVGDSLGLPCRPLAEMIG